DGIRLFTDQYGRPHADVQGGQRSKVYDLEDKKVKNLVVHWLLDHGEAPSAKAVGETLAVWHAVAEEETPTLEVRSQWGDRGRARLWVALGAGVGGGGGGAGGGCTRVEPPPVPFRRFPHMEELPEPDLSGDARALLDFLPPLANEGDELLVLIFAVLAWVPIE